jgi:hypothetical protein
MEKGIWQEIEGKKVFIEFGQDIAKQIIEQLKETKEIEVKKQEIDNIRDYRPKKKR